MTDARSWAGTAPLPPLLSALAVLPRGARDGEGVPSLGIAFRGSPTSPSSCAHVDFSREKSGQILLWSSALCHFAAVFISPGQNQMVNTL